MAIFAQTQLYEPKMYGLIVGLSNRIVGTTSTTCMPGCKRATIAFKSDKWYAEVSCRWEGTVESELTFL